jgi:membrane fusion protein (multidrug efflux system)
MLRTLAKRNVIVALALSALAMSPLSCTKTTNAAAANQPLTVEFATVMQQDTPIYSAWIAVLDGYVNAQIQPHVTGYITKQNFREGSLVRKGEVLFEIDPRPFQAALDQAKAQLAQAEAQLGKAKLDVERDTPLAQARAIAQSQLDTEIQAKLGTEALVLAAKANVEQAQLNLEWTKVTSLVSGIAGIAQVQIGNLVSPGSILTSVLKSIPSRPISRSASRNSQIFIAGFPLKQL